jgi:hypothetical protein
MSVFSHRACLPIAVLALVLLASCAGPGTTARVGSPDFYWYAAKETYSAGDFLMTVDHLDHLIGSPNEYRARAIPWSLVLTAGVAAGYMDLADHYAAGARVNHSAALVLLRKASDYRTMASPLVLRFAQNTDKLESIPAGGVQLAFGLPKGTAAPPPLLAQVASGIQPGAADADTVQILAVQRNVLLAVCRAAGAPNDTARTEEVLGHASALIPRANFENAVAQMLTAESALYSRDRLDDPVKLDTLRRRASRVQAGTARPAAVEAGVR